MFDFDILENKNELIEKTGIKTFYTVSDSDSLTTWLKEFPCKPKNNPIPIFSSTFNTKNTTKNFGDSLGYCYYTANRVEYNQQFVSLSTTPFSISRGFFINERNFNRTLVGYAARNLITNNIWNANDEYSKPDILNEKFQQFQFDSILITIFSNNSGQASYRNFQHIEKNYNIKNEFFWMSVEKMKELADQNGYDELYNDARTSSDRYVYKLLFGEERIYDKLSPDAKSVLDKATELVKMSMELRQDMANDENHLNSWDAGYAQLKLVWKEHFQEEFKEFRQLYKTLEERMRPLVYELGFLKK